MFHPEGLGESPHIEESSEEEGGTKGEIGNPEQGLPFVHEREGNLYDQAHYKSGEGDFSGTEKIVEEHLAEFVDSMKEDMRDREILSPEETAELERCFESKHWQLLACIWARDREVLFPHSLGTFKIAFRKFKRHFVVGEKKLETLGAILERELGADEASAEKNFYCSCVLHDIGKLGIDSSVFENSVSDDESMNYVVRLSASNPERAREILRRIPGFQERSLPESDATSQEIKKDEIQEILAGRRMNKFMTIRELYHIEFGKQKSAGHISKDESEVLWTQRKFDHLERIGFSSESTLQEIIDAHSPISKSILQKHGAYIEALIAGQHHGKNLKKGDAVSVTGEHAGEAYARLQAFHRETKTHGEALPVLVVTPMLIRFCDELEAMMALNRPYKKGMPLEKALSFIMDDADREPKAFDPGVVTLLAADEIAQVLKFQDEIDVSGQSFRESLSEWVSRFEEDAEEKKERKNQAEKVVVRINKGVQKLVTAMREGISLIREAAEKTRKK